MEQSRLTRRRFVAAGSLGAVAVLAPQATVRAAAASGPTLGGKAFAEGVISGDPTPNGITLWSRVTDAGGKGSVELEIAKEKNFRKVITRKLITTSDDLDHAVKAKITGLDPYEQYYYRFSTKTGNSRAGRFRTALPADSNETVRFGYFSCQEFSFGYFNAHALFAKEDLDFVINLGDYIYQDVQLPVPVGVRDAGFPSQFATTLDDYRARYKRYRSGDANLRAMHEQFAMISTWDDHEVQNNYSGGSAQGGDVSTVNQYSSAKRDLAYRAFFEAMPTYSVSGRQRVFHKASFGKLVDLFVLDERQYRAANFGSTGDQTQKLSDPRSFLGSSQLKFAQSELTKSKAAWKVVANEVPIIDFKEANGQVGNMDIWQGFPVEREALLRTIRDKVNDVIFVTGDYHVFMAGDVRTANGETVATEFVGGSITSASNEEILAIARIEGYGTQDDPTTPKDLIPNYLKFNPWLAEYDPIHHGYVICEASTKTFKTTFKKLDTIRRKSTKLFSTKTYTVKRGVAGVKKPTKTA
jgi:alkaline phosphatase D